MLRVLGIPGYHRIFLKVKALSRTCKGICDGPRKEGANGEKVVTVSLGTVVLGSLRGSTQPGALNYSMDDRCTFNARSMWSRSTGSKTRWSTCWVDTSPCSPSKSASKRALFSGALCRSKWTKAQLWA